MPIFCADEDLDDRILTGVKRRWPEFEWERVVDAELGGRADPEVLAWAAGEERVLVTHDARTMPSHAFDRVRRGLCMPGVVVVPQSLALARAIEELELTLRASAPDELENRVVRLPL